MIFVLNGTGNPAPFCHSPLLLFNCSSVTLLSRVFAAQPADDKGTRAELAEPRVHPGAVRGDDGCGHGNQEGARPSCGCAPPSNQPNKHSLHASLCPINRWHSTQLYPATNEWRPACVDVCVAVCVCLSLLSLLFFVHYLLSLFGCNDGTENCLCAAAGVPCWLLRCCWGW